MGLKTDGLSPVMILFVQLFFCGGLFVCVIFFFLRLVSAECRRLLPAWAPGQKGG